MSRFRQPFIACLLLTALAVTATVARADSKSAELMAAYVYNFARFVEWPAGQFPSPKTPLVLCTPDGEALDGHLLRIHGRQAQNRRILVRVVDADDNLTGCHLLFLPARETTIAAALLATAAGKPVLTIANAADFTAQGGMIALFIDADRVHFDINRERAQASGLRVSSRLLALARAPRGGPQ